MNDSAIKELLFKMADDALIIGHRNSEWTGIGPLLEEDIAFSSMAQDKVGHAFQLYTILGSLGEKNPDNLAFMRPAGDFRCCHFTELPVGEYDFSLVRQFLFDRAEFARYSALKSSSFKPLAELAGKISGEIRYHILHGDTWITRLAKGSGESKSRMQDSLNKCFAFALGIFEPGPYEKELIASSVFSGEETLQNIWFGDISEIIAAAGLTLPRHSEPVYGGRKGIHTEYLAPLLQEMGEVINTDPRATW